MSLSAPLLSAFDPEVSSEGGVDPFSLSATYERLAERILPFLTVRMSRPRFLTAMAVGAEVCREFGDQLAADGKTPPWLVFEWHVIEAFLRVGDALAGDDDGWGFRVPGVRKVRAAVEGGHSVGAASYLKTPKIFGFTGIYRRLAFGLDILDEDLRLSEGGQELLSAWEADRKLAGFMTNSCPGDEFRQELRRAISQAMTKGCTWQSRNWVGWQRIAENLRPDGARKKEASVLFNRLRRTDLRQNPHDLVATQMRAEIFQALETRSAPVQGPEEPQWFRSIRRKCSAAMGERLDAIDAFEAVCAPIMDTFNLIRFLSTGTTGFITAKDFSSDKNGPTDAAKILAKIPKALERLERSFAVIGFQSHAEPLLNQYGAVRNPEELFTRVIEHHESAQAAKPPEGKRSWFDRDERGVVIRPRYRIAERPPELLYTHPYRSSTASRFLRDLGRLPA